MKKIFQCLLLVSFILVNVVFIFGQNKKNLLASRTTFKETSQPKKEETKSTNDRVFENYILGLTSLSWLSRYQQKFMPQVSFQDNEFKSHELGKDANFYSNPLIYNGRQLDFNTFDLNSRGYISVVKGNPDLVSAEAIPIHVSIRRNGKMLNEKRMRFLNKTLYKVDLEEVFSCMKQGDVLILNPARKVDWKGKRILRMGGGC